MNHFRNMVEPSRNTMKLLVRSCLIVGLIFMSCMMSVNLASAIDKKSRSGNTLKDLNQLRDQYKERSNAKTVRNDESILESKIDSLKQEIKILKDALKEKNGILQKINTSHMYKRPDGLIKEVSSNGTCMINLSKSDRLIRGLRFEVYDAESGVTEDRFGRLMGKATIEVKAIGKDRSRCRIIRKSLGEEIDAGDVIGNIIYHPKMTFKFYIWGRFNLENGITPQKSEMTKIARLVKQWGGVPILHQSDLYKEVPVRLDSFIETLPMNSEEADKIKNVADLINSRIKIFNSSLSDRHTRYLPWKILKPDYDFVILGQTVNLPAVPDELTSDPRDIARWKELNREYHTQQAILYEARQMGIPILNQNRFLEMIGHHD